MKKTEANKKIKNKIFGCISKVRAENPHVHCMTNIVAQNFTANALLAIGATPSMTTSPEEIKEFVSHADATLINLGTMDETLKDAIKIAVPTLNKKNKPWVLDPAFAHTSKPRLKVAKRLLGSQPSVVHCNKDEANAMLNQKITKGDFLVEHAKKFDTCFGLTGKKDLIVGTSQSITVEGGHPWLPKVTATGCAAGAIMGACLAVEKNPEVATATALVMVGVAAEKAAKNAKGTGTFAMYWIDELNNIKEADVMKARVTKIRGAI